MWGKSKNRISETQCLCGLEIPRVYDIVLEVLKRIGQSTVAELLEEEELGMYTNMNVSSVLRKLAENGRVKKTIGGNGKAFFEVI